MSYQSSSVKVHKIKQLIGHASAVFALSPGSESRYVLSGSGDGLVVRWDLDFEDDPKAIAKVPANVFSLLLLDQDSLLVGQMNGGLHLVDLNAGKELRNLGDGSHAVFCLMNLPRRGLILSGTAEGKLHIWRRSDFELIRSVPVSEKSLRSIAYNGRGEIAIGSSDNKIYLLDVESFRLKKILEGHLNSVFTVCYDPNTGNIVSGSRDAHLRIWNSKGDCLEMIPAHMYTINEIAWHPELPIFATGSRDKTIKIWSAEDYSLLKVIDRDKSEGHLNSVNKLYWSRWNNFLISCSDDRSLMVWQIDFSAS